jgi:hypothetical protein
VLNCLLVKPYSFVKFASGSAQQLSPDSQKTERPGNDVDRTDDYSNTGAYIENYHGSAFPLFRATPDPPGR